jgi:hypothetical protein
MAANRTKNKTFPLPAGGAPWRLLALATAFAAAFAAPPLHAAGVLGVSPQGEARDVRQVSVRFDADMVPLGQSDGAEPATLQCSPQTPEGRARWIGPRAWAFEFAKDVRGGTRCNVVFKPGLKTLAGDAVTPPPAASFVAGPYGFFASYPGEGAEVAPDQVFLLQHIDPQPTGDPQALAAGFSCEQRDGDKVLRQPAVAVTGDALAVAVRAAPKGTSYALGLRCAQPLPEGAQLRLSQAGAGNAEPKRFNYTVRPRFTAQLSCTVLDYPAGQKACDPRQPVMLNFSGGIGPARAGMFRLTDASGAELPFDVVDRWRRDEVRQLQVPPAKNGFGEGTRFTVRLPEDFRDVLGRPLANAAEFPKTVEFARLPPYLGVANPLAVMPWQPGKSEAVAAFAVRHAEKSLPLRQWRLGGEMGAGIEAYAIELLQGQQDGQWPSDQLNTRAGAPRTSTLDTRGGAMEFVGVPLTAPGLHVVRADSAAFAQYIDTRALPAGQARDTAPRQRYAVVQATNLNPGASFSDGGASVIWVTAFDSAKPVAGADVAVYACNRELLWRGKTDAQGLAQPGEALRGKLACRYDSARSVAPRFGGGGGNNSPWVVVRAGDDMALMQVSLAGERLPTPGRNAQNVPPTPCSTAPCSRPAKRSACSTWCGCSKAAASRLPPAGTLDVEIRYGWSDKVHTASVPLGADGSASHQWTIPSPPGWASTRWRCRRAGGIGPARSFQVEEFRTPVFDSELRARALWERDAQLAQVDARLSYFAGGAAAGWPVSVQHGWQQEVQSPRAGYDFYEASVDMGATSRRPCRARTRSSTPRAPCAPCWRHRR